MVGEVNIDKIIPKIQKSLDKLITKTDFDSITVKSIAQESGFSRQYFYRAFSDKYALIVEMLEYDIKKGIDVFFYPKKSYTDTLAYILDNRRIYKSILNSSYGAYLLDVMYNYAIEFIRAMAEYLGVRALPYEQENALRLYLSGVTALLAKAITGSEHYTKEELDKIFYDGLPSFLGFLKEDTVTKDYIIYKISKYREAHII